MLGRTPKTTCLASAIIVLLGAGLRAQAQQTATPKLYRLAIPDKKWALQLTLPIVDSYPTSHAALPLGSFVPISETLSENGHYVLMAMQIRTKPDELPFLTVTLSPLAEAQTAVDLRSMVLKKFVRSPTNIKLSERNEIPVARYTTENPPVITATVGPTPIRTQVGPKSFHSLEAYLVKDDVWTRLNFTAASLEKSDEEQFYSLLDSMTFVDVSKPSTSLDYYQLGRVQYLQAKYVQAAETFGMALKLERQQKTLDVRSWRDLIAKTAQTEATRGRMDVAVQVLQYGISEEPANIGFLMNLARVYASMKDTERTIATLRTTFGQIRQAGNKKDDLPDLSRDPAFSEMMKDKTFREAVKAMKKSP